MKHFEPKQKIESVVNRFNSDTRRQICIPVAIVVVVVVAVVVAVAVAVDVAVAVACAKKKILDYEKSIEKVGKIIFINQESEEEKELQI
jgi:hypothetical protein